MPPSSRPDVLLLIPANSSGGWEGVIETCTSVTEPVMILAIGHEQDLLASPTLLKKVLKSLTEVRDRVTVATRHRALLIALRSINVRTISRMSELRSTLENHPRLTDALRAFSPGFWQTYVSRRLARMGLLSLPTIRIYVLVCLSLLLFGVLTIQLLPTTEIVVTPRRESISHASNVLLLLSGATVDASRVLTIPLIPVTVSARHSTTFTDISKQFIGQSASLKVELKNRTGEPLLFVKGTRIMNQAGMIFRLQQKVLLAVSGASIVRAVAADEDFYGQIIGARGNVPNGLSWELPALPKEQRSIVAVKNVTAGTGGTTAYKTILTAEDLDIAARSLTQELVSSAREHVEEARREMSASLGRQIVLFDDPRKYSELTVATFTGVTLPLHLIGSEVSAIPLTGAVTFTVFGYDPDRIQNLLERQLLTHVRQGRRLIPGEIHLGTPAVIGYDKDLRWMKITVELTGIEEYVLDPLTVPGALFGKRVRERVAGLSVEEAVRIIQNMPEVDRVTIRQFPPWRNSLPTILAHMNISLQQ